MGTARLLLLALAAAAILPSPAGEARPAAAHQYLVLYADGASLAAGRRAVEAAGGKVLRVNTAVALATVSTANPHFLDDVVSHDAVDGAARNIPVAREPRVATPKQRPPRPLVAVRPAPARPEPLARLQWDMAMIHATAAGSYAREQGDRRVLVGIVDTGVDGSHPDIAPNFDAARSRNFTVDVPSLDGPCEHRGCVDPVGEDDQGHGTHVAGIVGAALNGLGIAGVAPNVTLVSLRAIQDSGLVFLGPAVDALTYAADSGIDVVNMSFSIDPWLYNCVANPADSRDARLEQRTIAAAANRALDYAHAHGVTLIAAAGNEHTDLGMPTVDDVSPYYPPHAARHREIDTSCVSVPAEGHHAIAVGAVGPSTIKSDYSDYGLAHTAVTAPGGYLFDGNGTPPYDQLGNEILSAYPRSVALARGDIDARGRLQTPSVVRSCRGRTCAYYRWAQGTSMAAPHAAGVAALIVSRWGHPDRGRNGGLAMDPDRVERILRATATGHPCPKPPLIDYTLPGRDRPPSWNATCTGDTGRNSIWGDGIVDALAAVAGKR